MAWRSLGQRRGRDVVRQAVGDVEQRRDPLRDDTGQRGDAERRRDGGPDDERLLRHAKRFGTRRVSERRAIDLGPVFGRLRALLCRPKLARRSVVMVKVDMSPIFDVTAGIGKDGAKKFSL